MYAWLKYVAYALVGIFIGGFIFDVVKHAREEGGQWKYILLRILVWIIIFAIIVAVNLWLNQNLLQINNKYRKRYNNFIEFSVAFIYVLCPMNGYGDEII